MGFPYNGILPLYKPKGMTSHDCVVRVRNIVKMKKVGHTGTLDPDVTGVLPICLGRATKVAEYMSDYSKTYEAEVTLGVATSTEDSSGDIVEQQELLQPITLERLQNVLRSMVGKQTQIPPMYSAVKVNGKRLYEYAFEGKVIDRPSREIFIENIQLLSNRQVDQTHPTFFIRVACSKGTYIRTLAVDIGKKLGYPAHMSYLQRIKSGPFTLDSSLTFEEIEDAVNNGMLHEKLYPVETAIKHFEKIVFPEHLTKKIENGAVLPIIENSKGNKWAIYNNNGECLAIYIPHPSKQGYMKPEKLIKVKDS